MNITEANAVNTLLAYVLGIPRYDGTPVCPDVAQATAMTLATRANKALGAGLTAMTVQAQWPSETKAAVLREILEERRRQDRQWGEQNNPDGTGAYPEVIEAEAAQMACEDAAEGGYVTWMHILREEVAEAFAETDPAKLRAELLQVSAVAVNWIEAIDRRQRATAETEVAS